MASKSASCKNLESCARQSRVSYASYARFCRAALPHLIVTLCVLHRFARTLGYFNASWWAGVVSLCVGVLSLFNSSSWPLAAKVVSWAGMAGVLVSAVLAYLTDSALVRVLAAADTCGAAGTAVAQSGGTLAVTVGEYSRSRSSRKPMTATCT